MNLPTLPSSLASLARHGRLTARREPPPAVAGPPSLAVLLRSIHRQLLPAAACGMLLGALAAGAVWFLAQSNRYEATCLLQVSETPPTFVFNTRENVAARDEFSTYKATQEQLIRSRLVLSAALARPEVASLPSVVRQVDPVAWLESQLNIRFVGEILMISLQGTDQREVVALVNAVTEAYRSEVVEVERNRRKARLAQLGTTHSEFQQILKNRRETLDKLAETAGSKDRQTLMYKQQLGLERHAEAQRELVRLRHELRQARDEIEIHRASARSALPTQGRDGSSPEIDLAMARDPALSDYQSDLAKLRLQLQDYLRTSRTGSDPAIRQVRAKIATTEQAMRTYAADLRRSLLEARRVQAAKAADPGDRLRALEVKVALLERHEQELAAEVETLAVGSDSFNRTTLDLEATDEEIAQAERVFNQIGDELERLKVEMEAPARITLRENAEVAQAIDGKKRVIYSGASGVAALGLALFGFGWFDARARRVGGVDAVVRGLGLELVGVLPALPKPHDRRPEASWDHLMTESIDAARTFLLHVSRAEQIQTLMVVSALKGEGKTSLACHLATSLARARRRTLLLDCDLRSPAAHVLFDVPVGPGACELLRGEVDLEAAVYSTAAPGLDMIPAGRCDADALLALAEGRLQAILDSVRDRYDLIVIDSAPVLPVADSLQIAEHVDAALFSVLRDVSRLPKIHEAYERLDRLGLRVLGAVVAGTRPEDYEGYEHGYGGRDAAAATTQEVPA